MDLITDLPPADSFDSILVVVDQGLLKGVILIPCNKTLTSEVTAQLYWKTSINDSDYQTRSFPIGHPNSLPKHF